MFGLLALVTAAGVLAGRALEPGKSPTATAVTTAPQKVIPVKKHAVAQPRWGPLRVTTVGRLVGVGDRASAAVIGQRLVVLGGGTSRLVLAGAPGGTLFKVAQLPAPLRAAAAFGAGGAVYVVGGEQGSKPTDAILRIDLGDGKVTSAGKFVEPLAESGVAARNGSAYLVGGWTGEKFGTAVLHVAPSGEPSLLARLPVGVRSPAVALVGHRLFVAGGLAKSGRTRSLFSVDTTSGAVKALGVLPQAIDEALLVPSGSKLYLLGGRDAKGKPLDTIYRINPATGHVTAAGRMAKPLAGATAVPFGSRTLVIAPSAGAVYRLG